MLDSHTIDALKTAPEVLWGAALPPHSLENVGDTDVRVISVELKD
jgi:hypothetical protein